MATNEPPPRIRVAHRLSRRGFVQATAGLSFGAALEVTAAPSPSPENPLPRELSPAVQVHFMRPAQLEKAINTFPVVYVPFGSIEWHGRHLPLGNDALKAHAILVKTAEQFGGAVSPPVYFHEGFARSSLIPILTDLFKQLKQTGFRVILGLLRLFAAVPIG